LAKIGALRAAAYIRVSTEEQVDGHSLDAQRRAIEQACAERGWTIVQWYADEGVSAHTDDISKRPAFHHLVQDAQQHRFDAVIVHKLDRWARSVVVALQTFKLLSGLNITFLSLSEAGLDFTSPMGKVLFNLLASFAEYYSDNLGTEISKGKGERRAKGLHNGLVPFGYRSADGGVAEPDPDSKDGTVLAFQLAAEGKSLREVAQVLNQAGYRTSGNQRRSLFTRDTVRDMLANRFYLGQLPVFEPGTSRRIRGWEPGQHPPLIDVATFEAARTAIQGRAAAASTRRCASVYSLSGLLRCMYCGENMRAVHNKGDQVRYYCRSRAQGIGCRGKGSFLSVYEEQLLEDLQGFTLPDDWKAQVLAAAADDQGRDDDGEARRNQLRNRLERLRELYSWGDLTREEYQAERSAMERELARLEPVQRRDDRLAVLAAYLESMPKAWADATDEQRNQLAGIIYEGIWVNGPVVEYVKPRPELEPLFQVRTGAAQPHWRQTTVTPTLARATPMGIGTPPATFSVLSCGCTASRRAATRRKVAPLECHATQAILGGTSPRDCRARLRWRIVAGAGPRVRRLA
jgi:DNA invertase Pin-like site-specific DNA recombinase